MQKELAHTLNIAPYAENMMLLAQHPISFISHHHSMEEGETRFVVPESFWIHHTHSFYFADVPGEEQERGKYSHRFPGDLR